MAILLLAALVAIIGAALVLINRHPITITTENDWAIGIYSGGSFYDLNPMPGIQNPVIRHTDVTDVKADSVSDPFMVRVNGRWHLFFEVINALRQKGEIGYAASDDGLNWKYEKIVLRESHHLSYPYVFHWDGQFFMIPESAEAQAVSLYRADPFPFCWTLLTRILEGPFVDTCVFHAKETWWMLTCSKPTTHDELRLYFSDYLAGPWKEHPVSPIVQGDPSKARPGGRVLQDKDLIIRFAQNDRRTYGRGVRAFFIRELTRTSYIEEGFKFNPIVSAQGSGWNRHGMHHVDVHEISAGKWIAAVDGYRKRKNIRIEY